MTKTFLERVDENRNEEANARFGNYVQSIAFTLTLSRSMIEGLSLLWHWGQIRDCYNKFVEHKTERWQASKYVDSHSVPIMQALIRRGLVIHVPIDLRGKSAKETWSHQSFRLTPAGDKVCELLVLAGLIAAKEPKRVRARA